MAAESEPEHRGKGHAAFNESDVKEYIRERGGRPATTGELAEEFGVSDVAIRKRIKEKFDQIGTRKVRNRRIWYIELDSIVPEADGYGSTVGFGLPKSGYYPTFSRLGRVGGLIAALLTLAAVLSNPLGLSFEIAMFCVGSAVLIGGFSLYSLIIAAQFREFADPTFGWDDAARSIWGSLR